MRSSRCQQGFSLVELLVVLLIMGILVSFAYPRFTGSRQGAQDDLAKAALRQASLRSLQIAKATDAEDGGGGFANLTTAALATKDRSFSATALSTGAPNNQKPDLRQVYICRSSAAGADGTYCTADDTVSSELALICNRSARYVFCMLTSVDSSQPGQVISEDTQAVIDTRWRTNSSATTLQSLRDTIMQYATSIESQGAARATKPTALGSTYPAW